MGDLPPIENVVLRLQKYRKERNLWHAKHVYALVCENGLETQQAVGNHVVPMLVECGGMLEAEKVFSKLVHQNVHAWTSLISGSIECGLFDQAFELYSKMKEADVHPSSHTVVVLLKACIMLRDAERGRETHLQSAEQGFKEDVFVNSTLMDMYFKCGLASVARDLFDNLLVRDVVVWNTLIAGYVENGSFEEALICFKQMGLGDCTPNAVTHACSLKACGCLGHVHKGRALHLVIVERFLETDLLVCNTLIDLYARCNSLSDAQAVFDKMLIQDVVSWNALITGLVEHGCYQEALNAFNLMQNEGIVPDSVTFVCILRACAGLGAIEEGRAMDVRMSQRKFAVDVFVGNTLVDMYAKCGFLPEAQKAFDELPLQDLVSWNALIAGYAEHGPYDEALGCFKHMQLGDVAQDATTYVCVLKACSNLRALEAGRRVHVEISQKGLEVHLFVGSALVELYGKCGALWEAEDTFDRMPVQDVILWNALLAGYVEQKSYQKGLTCLTQMGLAHISPNSATLSSCLKACGSQKDIVKGRELHNQASLMGIEDHLFVGSALVDMYAECDFLVDARNCFDKLTFRDVALWNALAAGYVACGGSQEALKLYEQMHATGASPDDVTFVCILKACSSIGAVEKGRAIHMEMTQKGIVYNLYVGNALLDMYAKCGSLLEAWEVFVKLQVRDVTTWNTIIKGYGINHDGNMAVQVFEDMRRHGVLPDSITFTCLLTACSRSSLVIKGQDIFKVMNEEFGIVPSIDHYNCMIDLHARSGSLHEAQKFLQTMPCSPSKVLWTVLLTACKIFVKDEVGFQCFDELVHIHAECATAYILMADIYTAAGRRNNASRVVEVMKIEEKECKPVLTSVECNNEVCDVISMMDLKLFQ